ncbi:MAG: hypothetical protein RL274_1719 [Pseudomonadota bacterium]
MIGILGAEAQPVGGSVVSGQAQISASGATTFIDQATSKAIINWQNFSVGQGAAVQFNQPSSSAITLNRVTGSTLSTIDGAMRANGQVWLLNPNGVLFGNGASINVGGLLATSADIADGDFQQGRYSFSGGRGAVVNRGTIKAAPGGSVVLSAPNVANHGLIEASAGKVVLGGTEAFAVDFDGDRLLTYAVGASGKGEVLNAGTIRAAGGKVLMTARAAADVAGGVINNTGMVEAVSVREQNGEIILDAEDGFAGNSGTLEASGKNAGEAGGSIQILGKTVGVADNAVINVSGDAGGGEVLVGGNYQGRGPQRRAMTATVGKAIVKADAISKGNGGKVVVWSDGETMFGGAITARGGAQGGNGGLVETSGHTLNVSYGASVSTLAPQGTAGNWLLDPQTITIQGGNGSPATGQTFAATGGIITIDPASIDTAIQLGNLTLQANTDIKFNSNLTVTGATGNTLTLQAGRSILLGDPTTGRQITYANGNLVLSANDPGAVPSDRLAGLATIGNGPGGGVTAARVDLILNSNGLDGSSIGTAASPFTVLGGSPTYVKTSGANVFLTAGAGNNGVFRLGNAANANAMDLGTGSAVFTVGGVQATAPVLLNNLTISQPAGINSGNPVLLNNTANLLTGTLNVDVLGGTATGLDHIVFVNSQALTLGTITATPNTGAGNVDRGRLFVETRNGNITLTGNIDVSAATLKSAGSITQTGGRLYSHAANTVAGNVSLSANGGSIALTSANNLIEPVIGGTGIGGATALNSVGQLKVNSTGATTVNLATNIGLYKADVGGVLSLTTTGTYTLTKADGTTATFFNGIDIFGPVTVTGAASLRAAGDIRQQFALSRDVHITTAAGLTATSDNGVINLVDAGHAAGTGATCPGGICPADIGNKVSGNVLLTSAGAADFTNTLTTRLGTSVIGGKLTVQTTFGDLEIVAGASLRSNAIGGDGVVLATPANFLNNAGAAALQLPNGGRFLIYSASPASGVFGGLNSGNTAIWNTTYPTAVAAGGNRYIFSSQPIITVQANTLAKTYGTDISAGLAGQYVISGLQPGIANAFLGDTAASVYSGVPSVTSVGAAAGAGVGGSPYAINVVAGSFVAGNGYGLSLQNGLLTINPALLTYTANSKVRLYGAANPVFDGAVNGFVNGDIQASATTGVLAFTTPAIAGSNVGTYAISGSGLAAGNYLFTQAPGNVTALTINPAPLTLALTGVVSKSFDGTTLATLSQANYAALMGVLGTDDVTPNYPAIGVYNTADVGTGKIVTVSGIALIGASAANYAISNAISGAVGTITASPPLLAFAASTQNSRVPPPPPPQPLQADSILLAAGQALPLRPPPPPPPPGSRPLAELSTPGNGNDSEPPSSSDEAAAYVVASMDGAAPSVNGGGAGGTVIPGYLTALPPQPVSTFTDPTALSAWGNSALWQ